MIEDKNQHVKIFRHIPELDAFTVTREYRFIAKLLHLWEWNYVVWMGRLFTIDNDYGEHWFDNHDERSEISRFLLKKHNVPSADPGNTEELMREYGSVEEILQGDYDIPGHNELYIVVPDRFSPRYLPACHSDGQRKRFWTDVLKSLQLSLDTLFDKAEIEYKEHEKAWIENNDYPFKPFNISRQINRIRKWFERCPAYTPEGIRIFEYVPDTSSFGLDAFVAARDYKDIASSLHLDEGSSPVRAGCPMKWIGRLFALDAEHGAHWFDNWWARSFLAGYAKERGISERELYVLSSDRLADGDDGPCHSTDSRQKFWRDVLRSLHLSLETLAEEARDKYRRDTEMFKNGPLWKPYDIEAAIKAAESRSQPPV